MKNLKEKYRNKVLGIIVIIFSFICIQLIYSPTTHAVDSECDRTFLGIPAWYNGLAENYPECSLSGPGSDLGGYIQKIVVNVIRILSGLFFFICIIYTMYGGYQILTGGSNPEAIKKGRATIFNGIIGGIIGLGAGPIVKSLSDLSVASGNEFSFLKALLGFATITASYVTVLMIVLSGISFVTSSGNPDNIQKARRRLIYAVIGLVIVVSSGAIANFVSGRDSAGNSLIGCANNCKITTRLKLSNITNAKCANNGSYKVFVRFSIESPKVVKASDYVPIKCNATSPLHKPSGSRVSKKFSVFNGSIYFKSVFENLPSGKYKICFNTGNSSSNFVSSKCKTVSVNVNEEVKFYADEDKKYGDDTVNVLAKPTGW